jgi:hypothetical protein
MTKRHLTQRFADDDYGEGEKRKWRKSEKSHASMLNMRIAEQRRT